MDLIRKIEAQNKKNEAFVFNVGDTVRVFYKIIEGSNERLQSFEGIVIAFQNKGISKTFLVRKISSGIGIEKIFPVYSPIIEKVEVLRKGKVRRAKLYYMRNRIGKAAMKIKERLNIKKVKH
ncbi:50S ribosomal protein L19 [Borreliella carolinensis]|uniref:Large ribosomal subunit protein bL19 n=1 Tax=Borreliella carolinensis TaxID=478174 RepID=A0ABY9E6K2_9SPIR|nr:50S ribosomal protein L19 [Borreliella carolinensis]WKC91061.1 50S ribosomal protein L19 [Borreliella carolinensis]WNY67996.1 50S ribosomal protein L19 [Borreliella carolinensis]